VYGMRRGIQESGAGRAQGDRGYGRSTLAACPLSRRHPFTSEQARSPCKLLREWAFVIYTHFILYRPCRKFKPRLRSFLQSVFGLKRCRHFDADGSSALRPGP
jgi:hypothetical protein